jgi:hypothetical protein
MRGMIFNFSGEIPYGAMRQSKHVSQKMSRSSLSSTFGIVAKGTVIGSPSMRRY